jgi:hypothetical protein
MRWNHVDLSWQFDWRGAQLQNLRILVCRRCLDVPHEQLRSYSPPPDPLPIVNPRSDESCMGNYPVVVTTQSFVPSVWLEDGFGNLILDGLGNPILLFEGTWGTLLPADPTRTMVNFALPSSFGLWINPFGGICSPTGPNCVFYAPGSYFETYTGAANAITYFTTIVGLQIVVQSEDCPLTSSPDF